MSVHNVVASLLYIVSFYIVFLIGKFVHDAINREYRLTYELVERDNAALALAITGYYFGLTFGIAGAVTGESLGIVDDLIDLFIYGIESVILLNISWFVCDKIILYKFRIKDELIRDQNQGTGAVVCAVFIASGLIVFGSVSGEGGNIWTAAAFWAIGQVFLILAAVVYNLITPYDIHEQIEKDNVAAGVGFAGALVSMGIIIGLAAERDFHSWSRDLPAYLGIAAIGLALLPVMRFLTDKVLLPTVRLTAEIAEQEKPNVGAAYLEAFSYIAAALVFHWCV